MLEEYYHRIADIEANIAAIVMRYRVTAFLNYEAMPVSFVFSIEFFLYLSRDVREMTYIVIFESPQASYNSMLLLVCSHVCPFNQHLPVSCCSKCV